MLFGLCFFHASIQELHFAYLCILFVTFEYKTFATSSLGPSLYSTSFLQRQTVWSPLLLPSQACRSFPSAISRFSLWFQQLMYSMSVLGLFQHNIAVPNLSWCQERCTYGPLGWNIPSLRHVFTFTNMTSLCIHHKLWLIPSQDCLQRIAKIYIYMSRKSSRKSVWEPARYQFSEPDRQICMMQLRTLWEFWVCRVFSTCEKWSSKAYFFCLWLLFWAKTTELWGCFWKKTMRFHMQHWDTLPQRRVAAFPLLWLFRLILTLGVSLVSHMLQKDFS